MHLTDADPARMSVMGRESRRTALWVLVHEAFIADLHLAVTRRGL